jgi:CRISPR-associated protein Cas5d
MQPKDQALNVRGEFACFTRPELKVERFSYPAPTPSAVRGIYDAIYCKPKEFRWQVTSIEILAPPAYIALRRNEVKEKINVGAVLRWMSGKEVPEPIWADGTKDQLGTDMKGRTQRQTMALKDVRYRLHAEVRPWPGFEDRLSAFEEQFRRRAAHGKCIYQPCFGCREFPAYFDLVEVPPPLVECADWTQDLGLMLYDVFDLARPGASTDHAKISLFRASVERGVLRVPEFSDTRRVLRAPSGGDHA